MVAIPYPYDWIGHWESTHGVKMSAEARAELIDWLEKSTG